MPRHTLMARWGRLIRAQQHEAADEGPAAGGPHVWGLAPATGFERFMMAYATNGPRPATHTAVLAPSGAGKTALRLIPAAPAGGAQ